MPLSFPDQEVRLNGLLHRKWVYPASRYAHGDGATSERWVYAVGETPYIVTFTVVTNIYPEGWDTDLKPYGAEEGPHRAGAGDYPCIYLDGATCGMEGSGIDAHDWYAAQPKNAEGFVHDAVVFAHLRDLYTLWEKP